ncbi:DUF2892 domain-containing protein [candidate division WOR-3 bacterium]|nr:DUF2892 domain-containing protein [candidate division WOR-3 bacterium]
MKKNMSTADRAIRFVLVIAIIVLLYAEIVKGVFATVLGIIGIIFVVTSVIGWCPLYSILKKSTLKRTIAKE